MVLVSIDVDAANSVVASLRAFVDDVLDEWNTAALVAQRGLCSTESLRALVDPLETIGRLAGELETRVELAVVYNTGDQGQLPTDNVLKYEVSDDTLDAVKAQLGIELAQGVLAVDSTDAEGAEQLHRVADALAPYQDDPQVTSSFWATAGPHWADALPDFLAATGSDTARADLEVLSGAFAAALRDTDPPPAFADIAASFQTTPPDPGTAWNRLALLRLGDPPTAFLEAAARANALDILRDGQAGYWDFRGSWSTAAALDLPADGLALAFEALANDPVAARQAISSGTGTTDMLNLIYGYARAFGTGDEVADAFGHAIEAGTGANSETMGHHGQAANQFAFDVITASATHHDVPWVIKDSLAAIATSYAPEMLAGSNLYEGGTEASTMAKPANWSDFVGLEPQFFLTPQDTYALLRSFGDDDAMSAPFDEAVGGLYESLTGAAARSDAENGTDTDLPLTCALFGNLAGTEYQAQQDVRGDADAFDQSVRDILATIVTFGLGKIPTPETQAAAWALKSTLWAVKKGLAAWSNLDADDTRVGRVQQARLDALLLHQLELSRIIIENVPEHATTLPPELVGRDGGLLEPGEIVQSPELIKTFQDWLNVQDQSNVPGNIETASKAANTAFLGGFQASEDQFP